MANAMDPKNSKSSQNSENQKEEDSLLDRGRTPQDRAEQKHLFKIALSGFAFIFLAVILFLKPYLPSALYHNFAAIDDYRFFNNRVVKAKLPGQPWAKSEMQLAPPPANTQKLLSDLKTTALLVIDHGKIAYEKYDEGGGVDEISGSFSMAKSIVSLLTGFAIQDGFIPSVNSPIVSWMPEWMQRPEGKITVKNFLTMASGLNWTENYWNPLSVTAESYYGTELHDTAFHQAAKEAPGTRFEYQSGTSQLLGILVSRSVGKTLAEYASEKLWIPLGAEKDALWSLDHEDGIEKAFCCFNARARDFARIGQFVLQKGQWNGVQLLNEKYIADMTSPQLVDYYGYQWWILKTSQGNVAYARGILGQYIIVLPQKDRVIVRLGKKRGHTIDHHPEEVRALAEWALQNGN
jgi:CubicO group peptidase (beta-lactamase class C family)